MVVVAQLEQRRGSPGCSANLSESGTDGQGQQEHAEHLHAREQQSRQEAHNSC
jgi:hypothetical protein